MYNADGFCLWSDDFLYSVVIYFKGIYFWFHQNGFEPILCYCEYCGNVGICWYNHFIARLHHTEFNVSTEYPDEGIQSVGTANAILRANILGEVIVDELERETLAGGWIIFGLVQNYLMV